MHGLDWIRCTAPAEFLEQLTDWGKVRFGDHFEEQSGFSWYGSTRTWAGGLRIGYQQRGDVGDKGTCCVELSGATLGRFLPAERVEMLRELLELGCKATRTDLAVDVIAEHVRLVERVGTSCFEGKLCGARTWRPVVEFGPGGECVGQTVYIGKRGRDGSGRYLRCYDKGLETGELPANRWHRLELECTGDVARDVARAVVNAAAGDVEGMTAALVVGAVSFRDGVKRRCWSEREECAWWREFKAGIVGSKFVQRKRTPSLDGRLAWLRRAVMPGIAAMAEMTGRPMRGILADLVHGLELTADQLNRAMMAPAVVEFAQTRGLSLPEVSGRIAATRGRDRRPLFYRR